MSREELLAQIGAAMADHTPSPIGVTSRYAVLMPLVMTNDGLALLYEARAHGISQAGDAAFPGGRVETGEDFQTACLRETQEELGIPPKAVTVLGEMDYLVRHQRLITCFVGVLPNMRVADLTLNPAEVDHVFTVPIAHLLHTEPEWHTLTAEIQADDAFPYDRIPNGHQYAFHSEVSSVPFYTIPNEHLWGITAEFTARFCALIRKEGRKL